MFDHCARKTYGIANCVNCVPLLKTATKSLRLSLTPARKSQPCSPVMQATPKVPPLPFWRPALSVAFPASARGQSSTWPRACRRLACRPRPSSAVRSSHQTSAMRAAPAAPARPKSSRKPLLPVHTACTRTAGQQPRPRGHASALLVDAPPRPLHHACGRSGRGPRRAGGAARALPRLDRRRRATQGQQSDEACCPRFQRRAPRAGRTLWPRVMTSPRRSDGCLRMASHASASFAFGLSRLCVS